MVQSYSTPTDATPVINREPQRILPRFKSFMWDQKIVELMIKDFTSSSGLGHVYIARLLNHGPLNRIKVGGSDDPPRRMKAQKCPKTSQASLEPAILTFGDPRYGYYRVEQLTHMVLQEWKADPECESCKATHLGLKKETFDVDAEVALYTINWLQAWMQTRPYESNGTLKIYWRVALGGFTNYCNAGESPRQRSERWRTWIEEKERQRRTLDEVDIGPDEPMLIHQNSQQRTAVDNSPMQDPEPSTSVANTGHRRATTLMAISPSQQPAPTARRRKRSKNPLLTTSGTVTILVTSYVLAHLMELLGARVTFGIHMMLGVFFSVRCARAFVHFSSVYEYHFKSLKCG